MEFTVDEVARMMDLSAVRADSSQAEILELAKCAKKYKCIAVFALESMTPILCDLLADEPDIMVAGVVGFPSGGLTTSIKVAQTKELVRMGCQELDMVINIGKLLSGDLEYVEKDIKMVIDAANGVPVKVILECHYLNDQQIQDACKLCMIAGARFVKTSTGWAETGATEHDIELMKKTVGHKLQVKAAGGVCDLDTIKSLYAKGARRFGVGLDAAINILSECQQ